MMMVVVAKQRKSHGNIDVAVRLRPIDDWIDWAAKSRLRKELDVNVRIGRRRSVVAVESETECDVSVVSVVWAAPLRYAIAFWWHLGVVIDDFVDGKVTR